MENPAHAGFTLLLRRCAVAALRGLFCSSHFPLRIVKGVAGDKDAAKQSIILQGVKTLANDPLRIAKDVVGEVKALGSTAGDSATRNDSALEKLFNQLGAAVLPEKVVAAQIKREIVADVTAKLLAQGVAPDQISAEIADPKYQAVLDDLVAVSVADRKLREQPLSKSRIAGVAAQINLGAPSAQPAGGTPPAGAATSEPANEEIVVTACPSGKCDTRPGFVHTALGSVGGYYNESSGIKRKLIDVTVGVVGNGGPVGYLVSEVTGPLASAVLPDKAKEIIGNVQTAITVGADSFFQNRDFSPVKTENANQNNDNQTFNAVTGVNLVTQVIPGLTATLKKLLPNGPKIDVVDVPDGLASSAANAARLREQLGKADFSTARVRGLMMCVLLQEPQGQAVHRRQGLPSLKSAACRVGQCSRRVAGLTGPPET
jgi:hypothetical protein